MLSKCHLSSTLPSSIDSCAIKTWNITVRPIVIPRFCATRWHAGWWFSSALHIHGPIRFPWGRWEGSSLFSLKYLGLILQPTQEKLWRLYKSEVKRVAILWEGEPRKHFLKQCLHGKLPVFILVFSRPKNQVITHVSDVYHCITHSNKDVEITQVSVNRWVN